MAKSSAAKAEKLQNWHRMMAICELLRSSLVPVCPTKNKLFFGKRMKKIG